MENKNNIPSHPQPSHYTNVKDVRDTQDPAPNTSCDGHQQWIEKNDHH
jgi:hypothetical protein